MFLMIFETSNLVIFLEKKTIWEMLITITV